MTSLFQLLFAFFSWSGLFIALTLTPMTPTDSTQGVFGPFQSKFVVGGPANGLFGISPCIPAVWFQSPAEIRENKNCETSRPLWWILRGELFTRWLMTMRLFIFLAAISMHRVQLSHCNFLMLKNNLFYPFFLFILRLLVSPTKAVLPRSSEAIYRTMALFIRHRQSAAEWGRPTFTSP